MRGVRIVLYLMISIVMLGFGAISLVNDNVTVGLAVLGIGLFFVFLATITYARRGRGRTGV